MADAKDGAAKDAAEQRLQQAQGSADGALRALSSAAFHNLRLWLCFLFSLGGRSHGRRVFRPKQKGRLQGLAHWQTGFLDRILVYAGFAFSFVSAGALIYGVVLIVIQSQSFGVPNAGIGFSGLLAAYSDIIAIAVFAGIGAMVGLSFFAKAGRSTNFVIRPEDREQALAADKRAQGRSGRSVHPLGKPVRLLRCLHQSRLHWSAAGDGHADAHLHPAFAGCEQRSADGGPARLTLMALLRGIIRAKAGRARAASVRKAPGDATQPTTTSGAPRFARCEASASA